jgi:hypothetical protein
MVLNHPPKNLRLKGGGGATSRVINTKYVRIIIIITIIIIDSNLLDLARGRRKTSLALAQAWWLS